jgi:hypothetical protein
MKRPVGYSFVVATKDTDTILYGCFMKDDVYTRFVKNGTPVVTSFITIRLLQDSEDNYELSDIWIGRLNPPRPGSSHQTAESLPFWSSHAFVLDGRPLQLRTVTKTCPY